MLEATHVQSPSGLTLETYASYCESLQPGDDRYLVYLADRSRQNNERKTGGLADKMKGIVSCLALAVATGRIFAIQWDKPFPITDFLDCSGYNWRETRFRRSISQIPYMLTIDAISGPDRRFHDEFAQCPIEQVEARILRNERVVSVHANWLGSPSWFVACGLSQNRIEAFTSIYRYLFRPKAKPLFTDAVNSFERAASRHDAVIGVHLRTGSGNGWTDPAFHDDHDCIPLMEFALHAAEEGGRTNPLIYFTSDSMEAKNLVRNKTWPVATHIFDESVAHLARSQVINRRETEFAFLEFELLGGCDLVVGSSGGFARFASAATGADFVRWRKDS